MYLNIGLANPSKEASKIVIASDKQGETSATTKPTEKPQQPLESKNDLTEICVVKDNVPINREITVDKEGNNCVPPSNDFSGNPISLDETDYVFYKVENLNMNNDDDDNDEGCKLIIVDLEH